MNHIDILNNINKSFVMIYKKTFDSSFVINELLTGGECYYWSLIAKHFIPECKLYITTFPYDHVFIKIKNKYYDGATISGSTDWKNLNGLDNRFKECFEITENDIYKRYNVYQKRLDKLIKITKLISNKKDNIS